MAELELEGLHADGEHLVLVGPDGQRFRLLIDDTLRAAVRRDRPRLEHLRASARPRPRDIQSRIRAGESAEDVARLSDLPVEYVRTYEGPVLAEREWVAEQSRGIPIGRENGAPRLGDLVVDRLAARGVSPDDLAWTAVRRPGEAWEVVLMFPAGGREREARWSVDLPSRSLHALDDEGRWLSEVELGSPAARRHLSPVRARVYDVDVAEGPPAEVTAIEADPTEASPEVDEHIDEPVSRTADLLDALRASRGVRHEVVPVDDDALLGDIPSAHPPASAPEEAVDAAVLPLPVGAWSASGGTDAGDGPDGPAPAESARKPRSRSRRTSVPSWDEIVFGAKPE